MLRAPLVRLRRDAISLVLVAFAALFALAFEIGVREAARRQRDWIRVLGGSVGPWEVPVEVGFMTAKVYVANVGFRAITIEDAIVSQTQGVELVATGLAPAPAALMHGGWGKPEDQGLAITSLGGVRLAPAPSPRLEDATAIILVYRITGVPQDLGQLSVRFRGPFGPFSIEIGRPGVLGP